MVRVLPWVRIVLRQEALQQAIKPLVRLAAACGASPRPRRIAIMARILLRAKRTRPTFPHALLANICATARVLPAPHPAVPLLGLRIRQAAALRASTGVRYRPEAAMDGVRLLRVSPAVVQDAHLASTGAPPRIVVSAMQARVLHPSPFPYHSPS